MPKITFLQLGDIHYPDWNQGAYETDNKDDKVSAAIKSGITYSPFQRVLSKISELSNNVNTDAIVVMGDFTTKGDKRSLKAALNHFSWLCKSERKVLARPQLLAVPGNHDVNKADAAMLGQSGKFEFINDQAESSLWHPLPVDESIHVPVSNNNATVHILLVNTTLGSWEKYLLPANLSEDIDSGNVEDAMGDPSKLSLEMAGRDLASSTMPTDYYDQLDTPYISAKSTLSIENTVEGIDNAAPVVIVGHHNVLPQIQPRLSPYSEMLNGGYFRKSLLELERPIVYLHGHVHHDIIEIIENPRLTSSKIYSIGAPDITQGFNEISFFFDSKNQSIGFRVLPWRFSEDKTRFKAQSSLQIVGTLYRDSRIWPSTEAQQAYKKIEKPKSYNGADLQNIFESSNIAKCHDDVECILLELFFLKWIRIENLGKPVRDWIITRSESSS